MSFLCDFPGCSKTFSTKTGRGVHQQKSHKDWYDARQNTTKTKARWTDEEQAILARAEAELTIKGVKFMNKELLKVLPERTHFAISSQRKKNEHKAAVLLIISEIEELEHHNKAASTSESPSANDNTIINELTPEPARTDDSNDSFYISIIEFTQNLNKPNCNKFNTDKLNAIVNHLNHKERDRVFEEISIYLRRTFLCPPNEKSRPETLVDNQKPQSRRKSRKAEYARVQNAWKKNRSKCINDLLKNKKTEASPPKEEMISFWEKVMTSGGRTTPGAKPTENLLNDLWSPISSAEIKAAYPPVGSSPGPDGFSAKQLKNVPIGILQIIFNIFIICGKIPEHLLESRTTLIPKKDNAYNPGDFRPITVSSTITRAFHKILANRMQKSVPLDSRQKAFRPIDGCSENIFLMDLVLRYTRQNHQPLFMATLDVAKAFDSVTHETIIDTLQTAGVPNLMIEYIAKTYKNSTTRIQCDGWKSHVIHPTCGVKQGDPLSPIIFNMVIDRLLSKLPKEIGIRVGEIIINAIGYADDLVLFASTATGLQQLLDTSAKYLLECGLQVNASKCSTVAVKTVAREKKVVVDAKHTFECCNNKIPALKRSDDWKYLGVPFTPEGRLKVSPLNKLKKELDIITKAPLKPQQRLFILRTMIIPGLYHLLVLGSTTLSLLNRLDITVRTAIRKWLCFPQDVPRSYYHADMKDGGLSIPSYRWTVPLQRKNRLEALKIIENGEVPKEMKLFVEKETARVRERLKDHRKATTIESLTDIKSHFAATLYNSNDGRPLKESRGVEFQHAWITDGTKFLPGRDFIHMNKLRINAIPLRVRTTRGRKADQDCRAGCRYTETLEHVLQICHRTHSQRIKRHDACLNYLLSKLPRDVRVIKEPVIERPEGKYKPDAIIINNNREAILLDPQIVGERSDLDREFRRKRDKYKPIEEEIKRLYSLRKVHFTAMTISSRGVWSKESFEHLTKLGLIKTSDAKVLSTRVLIGGLTAINAFNRTTAMKRRIHDDHG